MKDELKIHNLHVHAGGKPVLNGVNLKIKPGEIHVIMGPNGSGKSTLAHAVMGRPGLKITKGDILYGGKSLLHMPADKRAMLGLFLAFQYPRELVGVSLEQFLLSACRTREYISIFEFKRMLHEIMEKLHIPKKFAERELNRGFSGGEKKKAEILQLALLRPSLAILDEIDSGLDIDALRRVCELLKTIYKASVAKIGLLLITHYPRILKYLTPDHVHVMKAGKIICSGGKKLAHELEKKGYERL